jgi:hypothetical protein
METAGGYSRRHFSSNNVSVLLGNGNGTFQGAVNYVREPHQ